MGKDKARNKKAGRTREQRKAIRDKRAERQKEKRKIKAEARKERYYVRASKREELRLPRPPPTLPRNNFKASLEDPTHMKKVRKSILHGVSGGDWYRG